MTPEERTAKSLGGRLGAHRRWSRVSDRTAETAKATQAFLDRFEREVDPDGVLDPAVRARMAENAKSAYFTALALKSHQARTRKKKRGTAA